MTPGITKKSDKFEAVFINLKINNEQSINIL